MTLVFTPRKGAALEPQIREFCANALDPFVGSGELDFIEDLGKQMPMRVIGMLLGVPEADQAAVRDGLDAKLRPEAGKPLEAAQGFVTDHGQFADPTDWPAAPREGENTVWKR